MSNKRAFKSKIVSYVLKLRLCRTVIRPIVTYGVQAWIVNTQNIFERRILRRTYVRIHENNIWRICTNKEIDKILKEETPNQTCQIIKIGMLRPPETHERHWVPKSVMYSLVGGGRRGWTIKIWNDRGSRYNVGQKLLILHRGTCTRIIREAKVYSEM